MSTATAWFNLKVQKTDRLPYALLAAWVFSMITLPIMKWTFGEQAIPVGVTISVALQIAAVLVIVAGAWGKRSTALTIGGVIVLAWAVEYIGSHTGFPFGAYQYTERLQPQLGDVPLLIPFAWLMMLPCAWAVAEAICGTTRGGRFVLVSALAFTAWDLFLDPQMVAWGFWEWAQPGSYFGIPWVNFAGWIAASAVITALARPKNLPLQPLLLIYAITWVLETIGQLFFWNLPGPAVFGFVAMGAMLWLAWRRAR